MTQPTPQETADRLTFMSLHGSRFDLSEFNQAMQGLCISQTAFGMPGMSYCDKAPDYRSLHCAEHGHELRQAEGRSAFGLDIYPLRPEAVEIGSLAELRAVAATLHFKAHEPDEQDVSATVTGTRLDNATGVTGPNYVVYLNGPEDGVWAVNLSELIEWASYGA